MSYVWTREELETIPAEYLGIEVDGVVRQMTEAEREAFIVATAGTSIDVPPDFIDLFVPSEPTVEEIGMMKRLERNMLLNSSDRKMLLDAPWDTTAWATYRQALRDLPADPDWPHVALPTPPQD